MRLINVRTLELESFMGNPPPYAILSHRWGTDKEEVNLQEWTGDRASISARPGFVKIRRACAQAQEDGLDYLWVDTNCIDKTSSAELSEAINSMFDYYRNSRICYGYLNDVSRVEDLEECAWFSRGWTLQELLAPPRFKFYSRSWLALGTKYQHASVLSRITRIQAQYITGNYELRSASLACRLSWVANRVTTRPEDIAYCMLGILDIRMPLLYGEGHRAFHRLQEEVVRLSDDQSVFCWDWVPAPEPGSRGVGPPTPARRISHLAERGWTHEGGNGPAAGIGSAATSMFAPDPVFFYGSGDVEDAPSERPVARNATPYSITNVGLSITLALYERREANEKPLLGGWSGYRPAALAVVAARKGLFVGERITTIISGLAVPLYRQRRQVYRRRGRYQHGAPESYTNRVLRFTVEQILFDKYFDQRDIFVPAGEQQFSHQHDDPIQVGVWCLEQSGAPRIKLVLGGAPPYGWFFPQEGTIVPDEYCGVDPAAARLSRKTGHAIGAVFKVAAAGRPQYVLVRGFPRGAGSFGWEVRQTKIADPRDVERDYLWAFGGEQLRLDDILALPEEPGRDMVVEDVDEKRVDLFEGGNVIPVATVTLAGKARWLCSPDSDIRFLCVEAGP